VSDFDRRWQQLVEASRVQGGVPESAQASRVRAEDLAELGLASAKAHGRAAREGRGLALSGLLYIGCLCGAGSLCDAFGWTPELTSAARALAQAHRHLPDPSVVPLPSGVPALQALAPTSALEAIERCWRAGDGSKEEPR